MQKWEYKFVGGSSWEGAFKREDFDVVDQLGLERWEAVGVAGDLVAIMFKRPLMDD